MAEKDVKGFCGTYPMPQDGWVCFHCGERFTTWGSAEDHFGKNPHDTPACIIKAGDERGLVMELRKAEQMAEDQLQRALQAEREVETLECRVQALTTDFKSFKPFKDCESANQAFFVFDSMEGRALAAEEKVQQSEQFAAQLESNIKFLQERIERLRSENEELLSHRFNSDPAKVGWHAPKTVGHLRMQLETMDPSTPIAAVYFIKIGDLTVARTTGVQLSWERFDNERDRLDTRNKNLPQGIAVWAHENDAFSREVLDYLGRGEKLLAARGVEKTVEALYFENFNLRQAAMVLCAFEPSPGSDKEFVEARTALMALLGITQAGKISNDATVN